ncbi:MAG: Transcriptional regulator, TrmB [Parcubacteria group bacterium GW2011_GWA2_51_10]|nr:MAG: Transcriptional regulator, TrmB [Parcubacteria group bacterium GW2011_GWA2_51_10]
MTELVSSLAELGLSKQEATVYVAALQTGFGSISTIAKKAGIKRPTAYYIIDELIKKNLISRAPKGKRTFYVAEHPNTLLANLRAQEDRLMSQLPLLESMLNSAGNKPRIRFYEGKEGIKAMYAEVFSTHQKLLAIGSMQDISKHFSENECAEWFKLLSDKGGKIYDLVDDAPATRKYAKAAYRKGHGPLKYLPKDFKLGTDTIITGNKVALISYSALIGVLIENDEIAQTQRQMFEFMWKHL